MTFSYNYLTDDEKKAILENRLRQFEGEYFNHELNKLNLQNLDDNDKSKQKAIDDITAAQSTIEDAITTTASELEKIGESQ